MWLALWGPPVSCNALICMYEVSTLDENFPIFFLNRIFLFGEFLHFLLPSSPLRYAFFLPLFQTSLIALELPAISLRMVICQRETVAPSGSVNKSFLGEVSFSPVFLKPVFISSSLSTSSQITVRGKIPIPQHCCVAFLGPLQPLFRQELSFMFCF